MLEVDYNSPQVKRLRDSVQQLLSRIETNAIEVKAPRIVIFFPLREKVLSELEDETDRSFLDALLLWVPSLPENIRK